MVMWPREWASIAEGCRWERIREGQSAAAVYRITLPDRPALYAKRATAAQSDDLAREADRLRWLADTDIPCPRLISEVHGEGWSWLLATEVPGTSLARANCLSASETIELVADGLRQLHALAPIGCPFDERLERRLAEAGNRVAAGLIDETDFDETRIGWKASELLAEALATCPPSEDLVVVHGDATFENIMVADGRFAGFVDLARLGVADRFQDLALACRSIGHKFGEGWIEPFLTAYGVERDGARLAFYQLLDEFF